MKLAYNNGKVNDSTDDNEKEDGLKNEKTSKTNKKKQSNSGTIDKFVTTKKQKT